MGCTQHLETTNKNGRPFKIIPPNQPDSSFIYFMRQGEVAIDSEGEVTFVAPCFSICNKRQPTWHSPLFPVSDGIMNHFHLHCHHWQNFHRDSVELIKAAPSSCLHQSLIDISYGLNDKVRHSEFNRRGFYAVTLNNSQSGITL